jgi:phosphatidate cytidylyltransferase
VLFALVSWIALREYVRLLALREIDRPAAAVALACVPINYLLIAAEWHAAFAVFIPVGGLLLLAAARAFGREMQNYMRATGGLYWGMMLLIYALSHAALLLTLPESSNPVAGAASWLLFVVILTEVDDITQALVGRRIGRHKITPIVSPNKTWEGFIGGVFVTVVLALVLAPLLTPFADGNLLQLWEVPWPVPYLWAGIAGAGISLAGFVGDINMSAIKRDAGVKDGSALLPGQGGMIDRIDSLTFSAPCFYYFVVWISQ